jgi:hypothetical protein
MSSHNTPRSWNNFEHKIYFSALKIHFFLCWLFKDAVSIETIHYEMMVWLMDVEQLVEWKPPEESEVLGEIVPQCFFVDHKSHMILPWE